MPRTVFHLDPVHTPKGEPISRPEFGRRLHRAIMDRGWRQVDLSRASGVRKDSISAYCRGVQYPTQRNLEDMATALGLEPDHLLPLAWTEPARGR